MDRFTFLVKRIIELKNLGYTYEESKRKAKLEMPKARNINRNLEIIKIDD